MIHVMNAAMMPLEGCYNLTGITEGGFLRAIETAYKDGNLTSWFDYQQNADFLKKKSGIRLPLTSKETRIQDGDKLLIMRLKHRVDGLPKGASINENAFEFFWCEFTVMTDNQ